MARPRSRSDEHVLDAVAAALAERPPMAPWALRDVAPAAGMSPAGLIKRFGSKDALLLALAQRWIHGIPDGPTSPGNELAELRGYLDAYFAAPSAAAAISGLNALMRDLGSPAAASLLREGWSRQACYLAALLSRLPLRPGVDPHRASLTLLDALHGSLYRRAVELDPTPPTRTLDDLLEGWT
jgi:AcrR family transcriptional regulator